MKERQIDTVLIMGLCSRGPYRYAKDIIKNHTVNWISWGYFIDYVHPNISEDIISKKISAGTEVIFATWDIGIEKKAIFLRKGIIDHIVFKKEYINFTIFLKDMVSGFIEFSKKDHYLCRYANLTEVKENG